MINSNDNSTINVTLKIKNHSVVSLENWLRENFKVIDFQVIADTEQLYENDPTFRKLVKQRKDLKNIILEYINKNG